MAGKEDSCDMLRCLEYEYDISLLKLDSELNVVGGGPFIPKIWGNGVTVDDRDFYHIRPLRLGLGRISNTSTVYPLIVSSTKPILCVEE